MRARDRVYIDENNPNRVRFVINGDPGLRRYPEVLSLPLPMHEKIREGMRRYAADVLSERGWCLMDSMALRLSRGLRMLALQGTSLSTADEA